METDSAQFRRAILAARDALAVLLHVTRDTQVVIVTDQGRAEVGRAFAAAACELGGRVAMYVLDEGARPLAEVPADFLAAHRRADVYVNVLTGLASETPFRVRLLGQETASGARVGHSPGITLDMLLSGSMQVDYRALAERARRLMTAFRDASAAHITAPGGTDFTLDLSGREFDTDVDIRPGRVGNLPAGEIWCAPLETGMNGVVVVDGSISDLGTVTSPLALTARGGRLVAVDSEDRRLVETLESLLAVDDEARVIGELGIGLNPGARLTGNMLEDEKAGATAHVAFGRNIDMPGGRNKSRTHRDFLFQRPTIEITYAGGGSAVPIRDGQPTAG